MIASRANVEIRFQRGPCVNRAATGTLQRGRDGDFASQHDFLLPGIDRNLRANEQKTTIRLSQVPHPPLNEKSVTVIIELGRRPAKRGIVTFKYKMRQDLPEEGESKVLREEGRMWVFIRPRGGQDCYLLTCEITGGPQSCPIHRFDGMDQIPMYRTDTEQQLIERTEDRAIACR
jgi:hypothetical protein